MAPPCAAPPEAGAPPPLAFVTRVGGALRLAAVDRTAQRLGIVAGLTLADARARHPNLAVADMDPEADRHLLQRLARRCQGWSPLVTPVPPDAVVLDSAGSDHLFGGEVALAGLVEDSMAELGLTCRLARADTPEAALALARHTPGPATDEGAALRALPVAALGLDAEATLALRRAGLKTLGDCAARPQPGRAVRGRGGHRAAPSAGGRGAPDRAHGPARTAALRTPLCRTGRARTGRGRLLPRPAAGGRGRA